MHGEKCHRWHSGLGAEHSLGEPGQLASLKLVAQSGIWLARGESCSYNLVRDLGLKSRAGCGFSFTDQSETLLCSRLEEVHLPGGPLGPRLGSTGRVLWTPALRSVPSWLDDLAVCTRHRHHLVGGEQKSTQQQGDAVP